MSTNEPTILDVLFCVDGLASHAETQALSDYLAASPDQAAYFEDILGYPVTEVLEARLRQHSSTQPPDQNLSAPEILNTPQSPRGSIGIPPRLKSLKSPLAGVAAVVLFVLVTLPFLLPRPVQAAQDVIQLARTLINTTLVSADSREAGVAEAVRLIEQLRALPRQSGTVECDRQLATSALLRLLALQEAEGRNPATIHTSATTDTLLKLASEAVTTGLAVPEHPERHWQKEDELQCALHVRATLALEAAFTVELNSAQPFYLRCVDDTTEAIARLTPLLRDAKVPEEFAARWRLLHQDSLLLLARALNKGDFREEAERLTRIETTLPELISQSESNAAIKQSLDQQPLSFRAATKASGISLALLQHVIEDKSVDPRAIVIRATAFNSIGLVQKRASSAEALQQSLQTLTTGISLLESLRTAQPGTGLRKQVLSSGVEQSPLLILGKLCGNAADSQQVVNGFADQVRYGRMAEAALSEALHFNRDDEIIKALGWIQSRLLIALWRMNLRTPNPETLVRIHATAHSLRLFSNEFTDFDGVPVNKSEQFLCRAIAADVFSDIPLSQSAREAALQQFSKDLAEITEAAVRDPEHSLRSLEFFCGLLRDALQLSAWQGPENAALLQQLQQAEQTAADAKK